MVHRSEGEYLNVGVCFRVVYFATMAPRHEGTRSFFLWTLESLRLCGKKKDACYSLNHIQFILLSSFLQVNLFINDKHDVTFIPRTHIPIVGSKI